MFFVSMIIFPFPSCSFKRKFNKKSQRWTVVAELEPKTYSYISDLQANIVSTRLESGTGIPRRRPPAESDPRHLGLLPPVPPPAVEDLVQAHMSRGLGM